MQQNVILALIVNVLVVALPLLGVKVGSDQLTEVIQTLAMVATGLVTHFEHKKAVDVAMGRRTDW